MTTRLKAVRTEFGWSQSRLIHEIQRRAQVSGLAVAGPASLKGAVSRWENGHVIPDEMYRRLLREIYGRTDEELGLTAAEAAMASPVGEELRARLATARTVDASMVQLLQAQTDHIRKLDRQLGAPALLEQMRGHIGTVQALLSHAVLPSQRAPLAAVLADAATLAGWQALDVGAVQQAWQHYETAKAAARESEVPVLLAHAYAEQAFALIDLDRPADAVAVMREAGRVVGRDAPALFRAWLWAAEGEALAAMRAGSDCRRALDQANDTLPALSDDPDLPFISLDEGHLARWRGHCLARLGDVQALDDLYRALDLMDPCFTRAIAGLHSDLASAHLVRGERDEADGHIAEARDLATRTGSIRQRRRIEQLAAA